MQHLIADLEEHDSHHGGGDEAGLMATIKHLGHVIQVNIVSGEENEEEE